MLQGEKTELDLYRTGGNNNVVTLINTRDLMVIKRTMSFSLSLAMKTLKEVLRLT